MDSNIYNEKILKPLQRWAKLGVKNDNIRSRIGHLPHYAPECYMHTLHKGITTHEIEKAETSLGRAFPKQYKELLKLANGAEFFSPSGFSVLGIIVDSFFPRYESHPWHFPIDILKSNKADYVLRQFSNEAVIVGRNDGTSSEIISLGKNGPIIEFDAVDLCEATFEWPDFDSWLISEITEVGVEHNDEGELLDISQSLGLH